MTHVSLLPAIVRLFLGFMDKDLQIIAAPAFLPHFFLYSL